MARKIRFSWILFILGGLCTPFTFHGQNFPPLNINISDSSATQGYYFVSPYANGTTFSFERPHLILDRFGRIVYYRVFPVPSNQTPTIDFKLQPDGRMSYFDIGKEKYFLMDSTFTEVDSIACANGFETDQHDLQVLPGNHYLLFGLETRIMDLSSYHWFGFTHNMPGSANAEVIGVVVQEFDANKNLVWEWKGHDHYQFGDVDPVWLFSPSKVDWTHANAVELDQDGNILLSLRHFNEITKIDRSTGAILWRLGGKQNQFTFPNDPVMFTGQHDIRRVSETSVTLFDNGQYTDPPIARALEYDLDETNKIATLLWDYVYDSTIYSIACGNHQTIENGNHLVDLGFTNSAGTPWMVVVKPDKTKVLEVSMPNGFISYRAFNYIDLPWELNRPAVDCQKIGESYFLVAEPGHPQYAWSTGDTTSSILITEEGEYWVFVPYGTGFLSSEHITITDITNPCLFTGEQQLACPAAAGLSCMPNPASDRVRISFQLQENSDVTISLSTLQGTEILRPVQRHYTSGTHEAAIDISPFSGGMYFLTLSSAHSRIVKRLIKL